MVRYFHKVTDWATNRVSPYFNTRREAFEWADAEDALRNNTGRLGQTIVSYKYHSDGTAFSYFEERVRFFGPGDDDWHSVHRR